MEFIADIFYKSYQTHFEPEKLIELVQDLKCIMGFNPEEEFYKILIDNDVPQNLVIRYLDHFFGQHLPKFRYKIPNDKHNNS